MNLHAPKRYTNHGRRRYLINWRWLWLYVLAPMIIIPAVLVFNARGTISQSVERWLDRNVISKINFNPPTPTATVPSADLQRIIDDSIKGGKFNNAISALYSLTDAQPNDLYTHVLLTQLLLLRGEDSPRKFKAVLEAAEKSINAAPEAADGWIMMAWALDKAGKPAQALPYILHARDLDDQRALTLAVQAEIYLDLEKLEAASALADEAIELAKKQNPANDIGVSYAYWVKGLTLVFADGDAASKAFERAWQEANINGSIPLTFIAESLYAYYIANSRIDELVQMFTKAADRDKDDPNAMYWLGRLYFTEPEKARPYFQKCLELDDKHQRCLTYLARLYYSQEKYELAAEMALRAIAIGEEYGTQDPRPYITAASSLIEKPTGRDCNQAVTLLQTSYRLLMLGDETSSERERLAPQIQTFLNQCGASLPSLNVTPVPNATEAATPES